MKDFWSVEKDMQEITNPLVIDLCLYAKGLGLDHDGMVALEEMYLPDTRSGNEDRWPLIMWCIESRLPPYQAEEVFLN